MQIDLVHESEVTIPANGHSVIVLLVGTDVHAIFLPSVRNLTVSEEAQPVYWKESAISVSPQGGGGRELVLRNNFSRPARVHVRVHRLTP